MGVRLPPQAYENTRKIVGRSTVCKGPIGSTNHQWGMKETPTDGSFTLFGLLLGVAFIFEFDMDQIEKSFFEKKTS